MDSTRRGFFGIVAAAIAGAKAAPAFGSTPGGVKDVAIDLADVTFPAVSGDSIEGVMLFRQPDRWARRRLPMHLLEFDGPLMEGDPIKIGANGVALYAGHDRHRIVGYAIGVNYEQRRVLVQSVPQP
jgi:hypothetical protein